MLENKTIVITRPEEDGIALKKKLEQLSANVYLFPTIEIVANDSDKQVLEALKEVEAFDWIIFTSAKGVDFFVGRGKSMYLPISNQTKIAAVGPGTAKKAKGYGLSVDFMPTKYTTEYFAKELHDINGKKILLARSHIGSKKFAQDLRNKGAIVTDIPIYKTVFLDKRDRVFEQMVNDSVIDYIIFTSPSTVQGFMERIRKSDITGMVLSIPVFSIGPVTTRAAKNAGFTNIHTADIHTMEGIVSKLKNIIS